MAVVLIQSIVLEALALGVMAVLLAERLKDAVELQLLLVLVTVKLYTPARLPVIAAVLEAPTMPGPVHA